MDLIELIGEANGIGIRELSAKTNFPPPTVHRILKVLVERGYLRQNQENKEYLLSTQFLFYADRVRQQFKLIPAVRPHLEKLSAITEASAVLCIQDKSVVVYIDHVHSQKHILRTFTRVGVREPLYVTGVGKIFLSQMSGNELMDYLDHIEMMRFTEKTVTDPKILTIEIDRVRKQGYAVDDQGRSIGVRCIAAPIRNHSGIVVAAISISGPTQLIPLKRIGPFSKLVMKSAQQISAELGYGQNGDKSNARQG